MQGIQPSNANVTETPQVHAKMDVRYQAAKNAQLVPGVILYMCLSKYVNSGRTVGATQTNIKMNGGVYQKGWVYPIQGSQLFEQTRASRCGRDGGVEPLP